MVFDLARFKDMTAVITDDGRQVSYAELRRMTDEWAAKIPPRSLVFLLVGNHLASLVSYVGCLNHGIVPLMLSENIDAALLEELKRKYRPDAVFRNGGRVSGSEFRVSGSELRGEGSERRSRKQELCLHPDLALLLTTSGSTGSPKLVRQSYRNIAANRDSIVQYLKLTASERPITTLPMNYTYGLSIINSHLAVGATILLTDKTLMQREFWTFFSEQQATSFGGVPYTYEMLDKLMFFRRKLPSLRTMTQAGGKILPALHKKFAEWAQREGKNFVVMYGQAEATARMSYLPPERSLDKVGSMGIAIPGGKFSLIDENGKAVGKPIAETWYDVRSPDVIAGLPVVDVEPAEEMLSDRRAVKDVFQAFGVVVNDADGRQAIFPAKSAGKMLGQRGIDLRRYARSFAGLFKVSRRAWSEREAEIAEHKVHRNVTAYHQYIAKAKLSGDVCYVRFTVREAAGGKVARNEVHSSTVSRITVYKAKGAELSDLGHAQVEDSTPFVDNKISYFLTGVNGELPPVGELVYEGDNVTLGYAECAEDLAKGDERGGVLRTGDMARVDEEGFYYIVGRKKRFLKIFGNRVNLDETERMIKGAFTGIDCACGGVDDKMKIYVQLAVGNWDDGEGAVATQLAAVRDFVAEKTHLNFTAFEVVAIDKIPKNESGKTLYAELK